MRLATADHQSRNWVTLVIRKHMGVEATGEICLSLTPAFRPVINSKRRLKLF
jgi:hypothetical protein